MKQSQTYYYWLDPIRALAALLVLFVHVRSVMFDLYINLEESSQNLFTQIFYFICSQGHISVATFFILSGFLVGGRNLERLYHKSITPKTFILNRVFRIGVPLTGAIMLIVAVDLITGNQISFIAILGQYLGLQFIVGDIGGVFWTLSYEIWFYLVIYTIILIYSGLKTKNIIIGIVLAIVCCCVLIQIEFVWFCIIISGIIAYRLIDIRLPKVLTILSAAVFFCSLILYFLSTPESNIAAFKIIDASWHLSIWIICCWSFAVLLSQIVRHKPVLRTGIWLDHGGRKLAVFSYSLFLTHYQVLRIYKFYFGKFTYVDVYSVMAFIVVCAICVLVAWLFYFVIERKTSVIQRWTLDKF